MMSVFLAAALPMNSSFSMWGQDKFSSIASAPASSTSLASFSHSSRLLPAMLATSNLSGYFSLTFFISGFTSYTLVYWYTKNSTASFAASLVYILNQWLFSQYTEAHGDILFSYSIAPILFLSVFKVFETGKTKEILITSLILAIFVSAFHPECVIIYGTSLFIFALVHVLINKNAPNKLKQLENFLKTASLLAVICFFLAAFLFLPMIFNVQPRYYSPTYKYYLEEIWGGTYKNLTDAFSLGAVEVWGYVKIVDVVTGIDLPDVPAKTISLIIFFLAYCTIFARRDKYTVFFVTTSIVSMFVAKGPYPPFGELFIWAWLNIPYFAVFRAANRWIMMSCLSHAFLIGSLVNILTLYIKQKSHLKIKAAFSKFGAKIAWYFRAKKLANPFKIVGNFFFKFHKALYYLSVCIIIIVFLNGFFSTWYFFREGLQVYSPPENYVKPYEWLSFQEGDFKVVSVNKGPTRWIGISSSSFDFGYSAMLTEIGWGHDIGFESSFIHDKPVMQNGGWDSNAHNFMNYLRFRLAGQRKTSDFLKIVGLFNYKYVVLPAYLDDDIKFFFLNQTGVTNKIVYNENGSLIIENPYYVQRFFSTSKYANVLGGFNTFGYLCRIEPFMLNETSLFFINQLDNESFKKLQKNAIALVLVNSNLLDLVMLQLKENATILNAADFGVYSYNVSKYWIQANSWNEIGALVYGGKTLTTYGNVTVDIPFEIAKDATYDIWIRIGFLSNRGNLTIFVDDKFVGEIKPEADYWCALSWVKMQNLHLEKGRHIITLKNNGPGFNDVDAIAVVEPNVFQTTYNEILQSIESFQGRIVDIMGAANLFAYNLTEGWAIHLQEYENDLLKAENALEVIRENATVSASSIQDGFVPQNVLDGSLETRWASSNFQEPPQWLKLEWPTVQELAGVKIFFEKAFAKDFTIQTWNGTSWVMQVNVTDNSLLSPVIMFREPVKTDKLLLTVNKYGTEHHLVSIFEIEPCKQSSITVSHFIPKTGRYMLALRLATGSDYGTLNLIVANNSLLFNCSDIGENFQWYEAGPVFLEKGEQEFTIAAYGKILFDEIILYSLKEDENAVSIQNLFDSDKSYPIISYETMNPTCYKLHVKAEKPFFLVFSETYHPLWKARLEDGQELTSTIAFSFVNSFYVNRTGEFDIEVYFEGQRYADIGLKISLTSFIFITIAILVPRNISERIKNHLALRKVKAWLLRVGKK